LYGSKSSYLVNDEDIVHGSMRHGTYSQFQQASIGTDVGHLAIRRHITSTFMSSHAPDQVCDAKPGTANSYTWDSGQASYSIKTRLLRAGPPAIAARRQAGVVCKPAYDDGAMRVEQNGTANQGQHTRSSPRSAMHHSRLVCHVATGNRKQVLVRQPSYHYHRFPSVQLLLLLRRLPALWLWLRLLLVLPLLECSLCTSPAVSSSPIEKRLKRTVLQQQRNL
jgi:hypothetical protein